MMTSIYFYCEFDSWLNTEQICMGANMICDPKQILETKRLRRRLEFEEEFLVRHLKGFSDGMNLGRLCELDCNC